MLFFLIVALAESSSCPKYKCKSDSQEFTPGTCIYYTTTGTTDKYYTYKCPSDSVNNFCSVTLQANSTCIPLVPVPRLPGEKCDTANPCVTGTQCLSGRCVGKTENSICTSDTECNVGLYCSSSGGIDGICTNQTNTDCTRTEMCPNDMICNNTGSSQGKCVLYYSISDYNLVASCIQNTSQLCNTGYCIDLFNNGTNQCFGPAVNKLAPPYACDDDSDCKTHSDENLGKTKLYGKCVCGYNSDQKRACTLFNQDDKANKAFRLLKDWYKNTDIKKCHTTGRFSDACVKEYDPDYEELMYRYYKAMYYPYQYQADNCVLKVFLPSYYHFNDIYDGAWVMVVGLSGFILA